MSDRPDDSRPPRGALIVIAIGLLACVVATVATQGAGEGAAASLEWVQKESTADSASVPVPGGKGEMSFVETGIHATGTNTSGYSLFLVGSSLRVSAGAPIGRGRILCSVNARHGTEIARSAGGLRATYPRSSSGGIYKQEVPETVLMDFSSHGSELAVLEVPNRPARFTTERGVKLGWPEYETGREGLKYFIAGKPKNELVLPFFTVWKTTAIPAAGIACTLVTSAGKATARTQVALKKQSPPIDEQAEEEKAAEREEREDGEG